MFVLVLIVLNSNINVAHSLAIEPKPIRIPAACLQFMDDVLPFSGYIIAVMPTNPSGAAQEISNFVDGGITNTRAECGLPEITLTITDDQGVGNCLLLADTTFEFLTKAPQKLRDNPVIGAQEGVQFLDEQNTHFREECS